MIKKFKGFYLLKLIIAVLSVFPGYKSLHTFVDLYLYNLKTKNIRTLKI